MSQALINLDSETLCQLDNSARLLSLTREEALRRAVANLAQWADDYARDVSIGIEQADRGELLDDVDVRKEFANLREFHRK